jgi:hypothetical protein
MPPGLAVTYCTALPHCIGAPCKVHTEIKRKGKVHPRTNHEGLEGVGGQRHAPAALPPGKTRYPLYRRLGGPQNRSGRMRKISPPPEFDPRTAQPVASRYTD